jgi:Exopolyphosphatase
MYGIIDIGSNTIRLVVYNTDDGTPRPIVSKKYPAGLASYITKKGKMKKQGIKKLISILNEIRSTTDKLGIDNLFPFGTAALRNITNQDEVLNAVLTNCNINIKVLSGRAEALLDYNGVIQNSDFNNGLIVDIGGGSTEIVYFNNRQVLSAVSMPIGSLNAFVNHVSGIIPDKKEIKNIYDATVRCFNETGFPGVSPSIDKIIAIGGTARSILKMYNSLPEHDEKLEYSTTYLFRLLNQLENKPDKVARIILKNAPERVHTLIPGVTILSTLSDIFGIKTIITCSCGVREGYVLSILGEDGSHHDYKEEL